MSKPRVIRDYDQLDEEIQEQIKLNYPNGFHNYLVAYVDKDKKNKKALPFETDDYFFLIRMSPKEAKEIISNDNDYDGDGILRDEILEEYQEKYEDDYDDDDDY